MVIELNGSKRTATVSVFKGKVLVNIREYYEVCCILALTVHWASLLELAMLRMSCL